MARAYAPDRMVSSVASTPTLRERVLWMAARAPGTITPMTGTLNVCCARWSAAAVAVLQAITITLTFCRVSQLPTCNTNERTSASERVP